MGSLWKWKLAHTALSQLGSKVPRATTRELTHRTDILRYAEVGTSSANLSHQPLHLHAPPILLLSTKMSGAAASASASKFQSFMNHPAGALPHEFSDYSQLTFDDLLCGVVVLTGPKTVFFWAPMMKWCLVAAGLKDINRPADKLSVSQNVGTSFLCIVFVRSFSYDY